MDRQQRLIAASTALKNKQLHLAFDLYKGLADEGDAESQVFVAWMLFRGIGCVRDEPSAASYYEKSAALGNPVGSFNFGRWLSRCGEHERAFNFYLVGETANHLPSIFRVGYSLARGKGVKKNRAQAYEKLTTAAKKGHAYALRELAIQDLKGGRGLLFVPVGLLEFAAAFVWGVGVATVNKDSDLLRG